MSDEVKKDLPFQPLGAQLKKLRERLQETLAEVSGAVEIEVDSLQHIEQGKERPSEDILDLLISHFNIKEAEAQKLWKLAGYPEQDMRERSEEGSSVVVLPIDARVTYTDMLNVTVNDYGVVMNFMQTGGPENKPLVVTRLGMSKDHARSIIALLQRTLAESEPRQLPPTTDNDKNL